MDLFKKYKNDALIEEAINDILCQMDNMCADSEEYTQAVENLERLRRAKVNQTSSKSVDWTTILKVGGTILCVAMILDYEKTDIVTSKAMSIVNKLS